MSLVQTLREEAICVDEHPSMAEWLMKGAADEIESLTSENERLRKALEIAGKRLYKEGAPQAYVDDVNRVLEGEEVEYYD